MKKRRRMRLVIDTMVVVRGIRAVRQNPPPANFPERAILDLWVNDEDCFDWIFSQEILEEYREVLERLKEGRRLFFPKKRLPFSSQNETSSRIFPGQI